MNDIALIRPSRLPKGFRACTSMRTGGRSEGLYASLNTAYHVGDNEAHVAENRSRLFRHADMPLARAVFLDQTHSVTVCIADERMAGRGVLHKEDAIPATDAVITAVTGTPLVVQTADCLPLILVDERIRAAAAVHCGWKGIAGGIIQNTILAMQRAFGSRPEDLYAFCSAAIGGSSYQVGPEVAQQFTCVQKIGASLYLDIKREAASILMSLGIPEERIETAPEDTFTDARLYSYRRDRVTGRMATMVIIDRPTH